MLDKMNHATIDQDLLNEIIDNLASYNGYIRAAHAAVTLSGGDWPNGDHKCAAAVGGGLTGIIYWRDYLKSKELYEKLTQP